MATEVPSVAKRRPNIATNDMNNTNVARMNVTNVETSDAMTGTNATTNVAKRGTGGQRWALLRRCRRWARRRLRLLFVEHHLQEWWVPPPFEERPLPRLFSLGWARVLRLRRRDPNGPPFVPDRFGLRAITNGEAIATFG